MKASLGLLYTYHRGQVRLPISICGAVLRISVLAVMSVTRPIDNQRVPRIGCPCPGVSGVPRLSRPQGAADSAADERLHVRGMRALLLRQLWSARWQPSLQHHAAAESAEEIGGDVTRGSEGGWVTLTPTHGDRSRSGLPRRVYVMRYSVNVFALRLQMTAPLLLETRSETAWASCQAPTIGMLQ